jgi:hypothetical protein
MEIHYRACPSFYTHDQYSSMLATLCHALPFPVTRCNSWTRLAAFCHNCYASSSFFANGKSSSRFVTIYHSVVTLRRYFVTTTLGQDSSHIVTPSHISSRLDKNVQDSSCFVIIFSSLPKVLMLFRRWL